MEVFASFDELLQHELGVPDDRIVDVIIFIYIYRVICRMDKDLTRRDGRGHTVLGEGRTDPEYYVGSTQEVVDAAVHNAGTASQSQGMLFGESTFSR